MTLSEADALAMFRPYRPLPGDVCELLDGLGRTGVLHGASRIERDGERYLNVVGAAPLLDLEQLNAYATHLCEHGEFEGALTVASLALRLSLAWLPDNHSMSLASISNVGSCLDQTGQSRSALPLFERAWIMCAAVCGEDAPETLLYLNNFATCLQRLGESRRALEMHQRALAARRTVQGEAHPITLHSLNGVASCYIGMGDVRRALPLCEQALQIRRSALGNDHPDTLASISNLAHCYDRLGEWRRALPLFEEAATRHVAKLGEQHPATLASRFSLAHCYDHCGESRKALPLFEQVLEQRRAALGEEHPKTLGSLSRLATCYASRGDARRALPLHEEAVGKYRALLGEEHPDTQAAVNALATCHAQLGDVRRALPLYEQSLAVHRTRWGEDHPATLGVSANLGACYSKLGQPHSALPLLQDVLNKRRRLLGEGHPETLFSLTELASCYENLGDYRQASASYEQALEKSRAVLGEDHPVTLHHLNRVVTCHFRRGQTPDDLGLIERVLARQRTALGEGHIDTLSSEINLAVVYCEIGELARARRLLENTLEQLRAICGNSHPVTLTCLMTLADCCDRLGETQRARLFFEKAFELRCAVFGELHPETLLALNCVARCHSKLGDVQRAMSMFERVVDLQRVVLGDEHLQVMLGLHNIAFCHLHLNDPRSALPILQKVQSRYRVMLGEEHPDTLSVSRDVAFCHGQLGEPERARPLLEAVLAKFRAVLGEYHPTTLGCLHNLPRVCADMGDAVGVKTHASQFLKAVATTELRDGFWPQYAVDAAVIIASLGPGEEVTEWAEDLRRISQVFVEELDLAEADAKARLQEPFRKFHDEWLSLAIVHWPGETLVVLAAIQGREMAGLMIDELLTSRVDFPESDPRREYLNVRQELRRLRLQSNSQASLQRIPGELTSEVAAARWRQTVAAHEQVYAKYLSQRQALADTFPEFRLAGAQLLADAAMLLARLQPDEALVLLFTLHDGREGGDKGCFACVLRRNPEPDGVAGLLPLMPKALQTLQRYEYTLEGDARGAMRRLRSDAPRSMPVTSGAVTLTTLCETFREALWSPLEGLLAGTRMLHVIVHDVFHNLPIAASAPAGRELFVYPGLLFYIQRHHLPDVSPGRPNVPQLDAPEPWMALHTDAAQGTDSHIPFVAVDAALVHSIVGSRHVYQSAQSDAVKLWEQPHAAAFPAWYFATHGGVHAGPPRQTFLYLDRANGRTLDVSHVLASAQRPRVLVLGCCLLARLHEDHDGNPLGLLSAFFLRGADYIVAAIQSVHDFYMPLLVGLFHQAWLELRDPHAALVDAKRRLKSGEWFEDTAAHLQAAYLPVLCEVLEAAGAQTISGWLLPPDVRARYPGAFDVQRDENSWHEFERDHCRTLAARRQFSLAVLSHLIEQRNALPADYIEHLCAWVCGFGCIRKT